MSDIWKRAKDKVIEKIRRPRSSGASGSGDETEVAAGGGASPTALNKSLSPSNTSGRSSSGSKKDDARHSFSKRHSAVRSPDSRSSVEQHSPGSDARSPGIQGIVDQAVKLSSQDVRHANITPIPSTYAGEESPRNSPLSSHDSNSPSKTKRLSQPPSDIWKRAKDKVIEKIRRPRSSGASGSGDETEVAAGAGASPTALNKSFSPRHSFFKRPSAVRSPDSRSSVEQQSPGSDARSPGIQGIVDQAVKLSSQDVRHANITPIPSTYAGEESPRNSPLSSHDNNSPSKTMRLSQPPSDIWKRAKDKVIEKIRHPKSSGASGSGDETKVAAGAGASPTALNKSFSPRHSFFKRPSAVRSPDSGSSVEQHSPGSDARSPGIQGIVDQGVKLSSQDVRHANITPIPSIYADQESPRNSPLSSHDINSPSKTKRLSQPQSSGWGRDLTRGRFPRQYSEGGRPRPMSHDSSCDVSPRRFSLFPGCPRHMSDDTASGNETTLTTLSRKFSSASKFFANLLGKTNFLYVFGGNTLAGGRYTIERYDINKETWERVGVGMPHFAESYAVAVHQDWIWVIGGEIGQTAIAHVYASEDAIEPWQSEPSLNIARASLGVAVLNDKLYVVGGKDAGDILDSTECYDSEKEEWIMLSARLNRRRHDFGCTSYGDQIYVAGGYDGTLEPLRSVEVFSAKSKQWTIHSNLNSRRRHFELGVTALTISSRLYAIGGSSARDLEYLDTRTSSWKQIPSSDKGIKQPYHRDSTAIATDRKFIYFIGGQYKDKNPLVISDKKGRFVYCYDTFGDGWSQIQDMIERRSGAKAIVKYDCKPSSKADGSKLPYKHDGSGRGNQGHADGTSFKRGMSHVSGEAPRQHESGLTTGSENRPSQAKLQSPVSKTARVKDISKIDQSNVAKSPKGARRNLGATGGSPSRVHQKSGIQGGARPKYSAQQRNSPGVRRKLNTPTKTYQPGATTQTGWQYNDGKSPKTRRRCEESIESGARPKTSTRPKIGTTKSSPTEPISIGVGALSPTARGSTSKPPTGIGSPVMQRNLGKSGSPARRRLESPTTRRKPVGVYLRPQVGSSPKSGAVYDARRRPATPPSNVYHSVSPGRRRLLPTPPYLFRPIQHTSPVRDPLKQDAPATYDAVELGDYLYVFGGTKEERGTMERYSLSEEKWEQCEPLLPHSGIGCAVALFRGRAWLIGGSSAPASSHREVHTFHPDQGLWERAPSLRNGRESLGAAVLGGKLFAVAGKHNERVLNSVEVFDSAGRWREESNLNTGRYAFGIAEHGGKLYVAGGADQFGYSIKTVETYSDGAWTLGNRSLVTRRKLFGLVSGVDGTINTLYALGSSHPEILRNRVWEELSEYDARRDRSGPAVASYGKYIYLIGGERSQNYSTVKNRLVHVYDTTMGWWYDIDSMHEARSEFFAVVFCNCRAGKKL